MSYPLNRILLPTDFSENARRALPYALDLARRSEASLTLFHAIEEPYNVATITSDLKEGARRKVRSFFNDMIDEISAEERNMELTIDSITLSARAATGIRNTAEETEADLIVMGSRGASGLERLFMGSVASEVVLNAPVPVLVIPAKAGFRPFERIIFATDYHEGDMEALEYAAGWARLFSADATAVHVAADRNLESEIRFRGFRELAEENLEYEHMSFKQLYHEDFYQGMAEYLSLEEPQLLVLVRHRKDFFHKMVERNHIREIAGSVHLPLLILPGGKAE